MSTIQVRDKSSPLFLVSNIEPRAQARIVYPIFGFSIVCGFFDFLPSEVRRNPLWRRTALVLLLRRKLLVINNLFAQRAVFVQQSLNNPR